MSVNFRGYLFNDAGTAIQNADVVLLETGTTTQEATTTTDSNGLWYFNESDQDRYDIKISYGSSVRYMRWDDQISLKEIDIRNNTGNTTPAATFTNLTDNAANQVAVFSGANSTKADDDEIYLSFKMHDSAGNLDEFARMTVVATDVTSGSEDGQFEFDVMKGGSLIKAFTIASSTTGSQSIDFNQDSVTFGTGTAATDITLTFDAESADGVITWMEDEDYFKFSDEILMNGTEKILFGDTATFIHQSSDGVMTIDGEATIDLNASTAVLVSNDLKLNSDSAVLGFGSDNDTTLTHTDGTGLTLNSTNKLTFGDTGTFIHQSSDGVLTITSDTTVDINGAVVFDGAITGATNITLSGELDAATLDISGNADIDGTLEADAITVDGATLAEYIADTVGAMVSSNTESGITVAYQDGDNTLDFTVGTLNQDTTGTAAIATTVTITDNESTNEENAIIFTAGGDVDGGNLGLESDGDLTYNPSTGTVTATIFKGNIDAVDGDFDGTLEADAITINGTNVVSGSLITTLGTISAGVWNGTAITGAYINDDIISGQTELASGGIAAADELLISDGGTVKRIGVDNYIIDSPALVSEAAIANGDYLLFLDGGATGSAKKEALADLVGLMAGTVTTTGLSDASSVLKLDIQNMTASTTIADADLIVIDDGAGGTLRKMTRANFIESAALDSINIDGGAIDGTVIGANSAAAGTFAALISTTFAPTDDITTAAGKDLNLGDGGNVNITAPLLAGADHTYSGTTAQMLAGGAIGAFDLVCIHTTTQEIVKADASAVGTARAIGIAPAAISDEATGTVLLHGFIRDDTWNWTTGGVIYTSETAGDLTQTAPTTDGAFVQVVGIALEPDVVFFNPSLDIIEHA